MLLNIILGSNEVITVEQDEDEQPIKKPKKDVSPEGKQIPLELSGY